MFFAMHTCENSVSPPYLCTPIILCHLIFWSQSAGVQLWNALLIVWTLYQLVGTTFRIAFYADLAAGETALAIWYLVDWALDALPLADIVLRSVFVSYLELGVEVRDADRIWRHYVHRSSFWADLVAVLPFDAFAVLAWHAYGGSLSALLSALLSGGSLASVGPAAANAAALRALALLRLTKLARLAGFSERVGELEQHLAKSGFSLSAFFVDLFFALV